MMVDFVGYYKV